MKRTTYIRNIIENISYSLKTRNLVRGNQVFMKIKKSAFEISTSSLLHVISGKAQHTESELYVDVEEKYLYFYYFIKFTIRLAYITFLFGQYIGKRTEERDTQICKTNVCIYFKDKTYSIFNQTNICEGNIRLKSWVLRIGEIVVSGLG